MKYVSCLLLVAAALVAQDLSAVRRLNSTLLTLKDGAARSSVGRQFAADIATVSDPGHRPSPINVRQLADELTASLSAGSLRVDLLSAVTTPIVEVLHSAGTSTVGFYESVSRAEKSLASLGVPAPQAKRISESLRAIGMQVRGPEDTPVR